LENIMALKKNLSLLPLLAVASIALATGLRAADSTALAPVDAITAGDVPNESAHQMKGDQTDAKQILGRVARVTGTNGWFSWTLRVLPDTPQELTVDFGGPAQPPADPDTGRRPNPVPVTMQISADGRHLANVRLSGGMREEYYPLTNLTAGPTTLTVRFETARGTSNCGVYAVKIEKIPPPTIASLSKASSTRTNYQYIVNVINDQHEPTSSGDRFKKHFDWWPAHATNQWAQYDFAAPARVSAVEVYWFDDFDIHVGDCTPPKSWQLLYRDHGEWKPVTGASAYGCEKDQYNRTTFDPVQTDGLRLDVQMPDRHSAGILQWKVEAAP
jgi:hypothetical protein